MVTHFPGSLGTGRGLKAKNLPSTVLLALLVLSFTLVVLAFVQPAAGSTLTVATPTASPSAVGGGGATTLTAGFSGGTGSYTCQWLQQAPGGSWSDLGSSYGCTSPASASSGPLFTTGTWSFELEVTAGSTVTSSAVSVGVVGSPPPLTISADEFDAGQVVSVTATLSWSGGTSPYSVELYSSTTSTCDSSSTVVAVSPGSNPLTGLTASPAAFAFPSPETDTWYCGVVTDHMGVTATSLSEEITVNAALTRPTISVTPSTVDSGQGVALSTTTSFTGGTGPYTCQWLSKAPGSTSYSNFLSSFACSGSESTPSGALSTVGVWSLELQVTDSASTPVVVVSTNAVTVTVNAALSVATPTASQSTIDQGMSSTLSATFAGGSATYTCQWKAEPPGVGYYSDLGSSSACATPDSKVVSPTYTGAWSYVLEVTDSAENSVASSSVTVNVNAPVSAGAVTPPGPVTVDSGQSIDFKAGASGGSATYYYQWFYGASATCSSDTPDPGATGSTFSFTFVSTGSFDVCYSVADSISPASSVYSAAVSVTVHAAIAAPAPGVSLPMVDSGQSVTFTAAPTGGTSPYAYAWYASSTCTGTAVSGATSSTLSLALTSTSAYYYLVTDSSQGSPAASACSAGTTVTVEPDPSGVAVSLTPNPIDFDSPPASLAVKVTWTGGIAGSGYTVNVTSGSSPTCSSDTVPEAFAAGVSGTQDTFHLTVPTSDTYFCATVWDGAATPLSASSPTVEFVIMGHFSAVAPGLSPTVLDAGQVAPIAASLSWSGGTAPYTVTLFNGSSSNCASDTTVVPVIGASDPLTDQTGTSASISFDVNATTAGASIYYCVSVTDHSGLTTESLASVIEVNTELGTPTLAITSPGASPVTIDLSQVVSVTASFSNTGTFPYTCQWQDEQPGSSTYASLNSAFACTFPQSATLTSDLTSIGGWNVRLEVTDVTGSKNYSNSVTINVNSDPAVQVPAITPAVINSGQTGVAAIVVSFSGGTGPSYTVSLYSGPSSSSCTGFTLVQSGGGPDELASGSNPQAVASSPATFDVEYPTSTTYFCAVVTDSATTPFTATSTPSEFMVNSQDDPKTTLSTSCTVASRDEWTCQATLKGFTGSVLGESVSWYKASGSGDVSFSPESCSLSTTGRCSITVAGTKAGPVGLETVYFGDISNAGSIGKAQLRVSPTNPALVLSCTSTSVDVGSSVTCTATLKGYGASVSGEEVTWTVTGKGGATPSTYTCYLSAKGTCSVTVTGDKTGKVSVTASYAGDSLNAARTTARTLVVKQ